VFEEVGNTGVFRVFVNRTNFDHQTKLCLPTGAGNLANEIVHAIFERAREHLGIQCQRVCPAIRHDVVGSPSVGSSGSEASAFASSAAASADSVG